MSIIYVLITVSVIVAVIFFFAFLYSVKRGQYDDTYTPSVRMLFDDELVLPTKKKEVPPIVKEKTPTSNQ
jgi:cbb3-type cytochrome oxidase maturation protein